VIEPFVSVSNTGSESGAAAKAVVARILVASAADIFSLFYDLLSSLFSFLNFNF